MSFKCYELRVTECRMLDTSQIRNQKSEIANIFPPRVSTPAPLEKIWGVYIQRSLTKLFQTYLEPWLIV